MLQPHDVDILVCTSSAVNRGDPELCLRSCELYAPGHTIIWAVSPGCVDAIDLDEPLGFPWVNCGVTQPSWCESFGAAYNFAVSQSKAKAVILLNDDAVLLPDTVRLLLEDHAFIHRTTGERPPAFVSSRSNYIAGPQNIRWPNGSSGDDLKKTLQYPSETNIVAAEMVVPVCALIEREVFLEVGGFAPIDWYSDNLICWDLKKLGYGHYVSRSYVHHVGKRTTGQKHTNQQQYDRAMAWLKEHRKDFYDQCI